MVPMDTLSNEHQHRHYQKRLIIYVIGVSFGSVSFGYASAIIATTLGQPSFIEYMNIGEDRHNASSIIGAMNALFYAGGFFGSVFNSWYVDRFGRKSSIITSCLLMIVSAALCSGSVDITMFIVFRFFTGWSCLMLLISVPLWITEVAPPKGRGIMANIHALMAVLGYVLASWVGVGFFFYQNGSRNQWRAPLAFACLPPLITLGFTFVVPESPRYLLMRDRHDEALKILRSLHHNSKENNDHYAVGEYQQMKQQHDLDRSLDSSWRILVTRPSYRKRVLIACSLLTFIYSSGTLTVSNYGPTLFAELGYTAPRSLYFQGGIVLVSSLALSISFFVVDRIPRNIILATGMIAVAIPLALEAARVAEFLNTDNKSGLAAGVAFLYLYIFIYGMAYSWMAQAISMQMKYSPHTSERKALCAASPLTA
ncbi:hypothetical protein RBB50_004366 [Rhinocladiella similis]